MFFSQFSEESTLNSEKDYLDFINGSVGSYINMFVVLNINDVDDFLHLLQNFKGSAEDEKMAQKYFISRSDPKFWQTYDWFQEHFNKTDPIESGLYDLNRYHRTPW